MDWKSPGGVKYRAAYAANNNWVVYTTVHNNAMYLQYNYGWMGEYLYGYMSIVNWFMSSVECPDLRCGREMYICTPVQPSAGLHTFMEN